MDERALDKFIAYVSRFDEAKAIGAGESAKLAAALTGCFILIELHEEVGGAGGGAATSARTAAAGTPGTPPAGGPRRAGEIGTSPRWGMGRRRGRGGLE